MKCPKCGLLNPPAALRCDCGYDFPSGVVKESYVSQDEKDRLKPPRPYHWYWPKIYDLGTAKQAVVSTSDAAFWVAGVTAALAVLSLFGIEILGSSPWALIDAALFAALAFGVRRASRICAVLALVLYVVEVAQMATKQGRLGNLAILLVLIFVGGVRGAFWMARHGKESPSALTT